MAGSILGAIAGSFISINSKGIDFAMTALFVVIFVEQWMEKKNRIAAVTGVVSSFICLFIFGTDSFVLPSMGMIAVILLVGRQKIEKEEDENAS